MDNVQSRTRVDTRWLLRAQCPQKQRRELSERVATGNLFAVVLVREAHQ